MISVGNAVRSARVRVEPALIDALGGGFHIFR